MVLFYFPTNKNSYIINCTQDLLSKGVSGNLAGNNNDNKITSFETSIESSTL